MACPACSQPVPPGARFCPNCGTALTRDAVPAEGPVNPEARRFVTVLFADVVGFTALAEDRDPEHVKRMIDAAFAQLVGDVEAHGGTVDKVLGDAIIALFGAPVAHEDDADRAVRAGLAMQATLRLFRSEHPGDDVRMRIGVNSGEVLVGSVAGSDYTAMGDVVNTAARLQQLAAPGAVLVGDATRQLCSPALRFRAHDRVKLRGRTEPVQVWQAVAHDAAVIARRWQSTVRFVGRTTELGMLRNLATIAMEGRGAIVAVTGEAGIGKSRLVHEVLDEVIEQHPGALLLEGACAPYGESSVWWPVVGGLFARLGLERGASADDTRRRVRRRLEPFEELDPGSPEFDRFVEVVMHLLGHPSALDPLGPAATREAVLAGIVGGLRRRAEMSPVVLWIDDLQWAAPLLVELLEAAARRMADLPLLIVTTYRPSEDGLVDWPPSVDPALTLHLPLAPLPSAESNELAVAAAGRELPPATVASIATRAGGNPLFLIELARLATASPAGVDAAHLPGTLRALIAARLDELTPSQRAVLDNAAILGLEGKLTSLREFAGEMGQAYDPADVDALDSLGLIVHDGGRWQFRSDVVREVAYGTLTKQARAQRHAGVARHLATVGDAFVDERAHHLAAAAELVAEIGPTPGVPREAAPEAAGLLLAAARRWYLQGAHRRGLQLIERALALDPDDATRRAALLAIAEGLVETHALVRARDVLADVLLLADQAGDPITRAEVLRLRGMVAQMEGDLVSARRDLGRAVGELRELSDDEHLGEALRARGFAEIFGGSLRDAEWFLGEADEVFARTGNVRGRAWVQQHRAWVSFLNGDHRESHRRLADAIDAFERLGDRAGVSWSRGLRAYVHHFDRRNDEADALAEIVLDEARRWGDDWGVAMMLNLRASIRLWNGDIDAARHLAEKSLAAFRRLDDRFGIVQALGTLNRALVASGRTLEVDRSIEEILALADAFGEMAYPVMAAAGAAMHAGHGRRAVELAADAIRHLDSTGANIDEGRVVSAFGYVLAGEPEAALTELLAVDVDASPFALAARATAHAMLGDAVGACRDVEAVEAIACEQGQCVSYWDLWVARVAGAAAAGGDECDRRVAELSDAAPDLADVVVRAYALDVIGRLTDGHGGEAPGVVAPRGWGDVAAAVVAARVVDVTPDVM